MEIKIGKPHNACCVTQRPFAHEEEVVSLVRLQGGALVREDYSHDAWNDTYAQGAFAVWNARYIDPKIAEQAPPETFSPLRRIFYDASQEDSRESAAIAYLAAQLLRRQKVFRLIKEADDAEEGARISLFTDRIAERLVEARDPQFSFEELQNARKALMTRLNELESPGETAESAGEPGQQEENRGDAQINEIAS